MLAGIAITLGVAVATAMIAVATDIGDKINRELRSYGANLVVTPQEDTLDVEVGGVNLKPPSDGAFLNEADLPKIRGTFWHHNIVGFSPMLPVTVKLGAAATQKMSRCSAPTSIRRSASAKKTSPPACASLTPGGKSRVDGRLARQASRSSQPPAVGRMTILKIFS